MLRSSLDNPGQQFGEIQADLVDSRLLVFNRGLIENRGDTESQLVWGIQLRASAAMIDETIYVDAVTGTLAYQLSGTRELYRVVYDCSTYGDGKCYVNGFNSDYPDYRFGRSEPYPPRGASDQDRLPVRHRHPV